MVATCQEVDDQATARGRSSFGIRLGISARAAGVATARAIAEEERHQEDGGDRYAM